MSFWSLFFTRVRTEEPQHPAHLSPLGLGRASISLPWLYLSGLFFLSGCGAAPQPYRTADHWNKSVYEQGSGDSAYGESASTESDYAALSESSAENQEPQVALSSRAAPVVPFKGSVARIAPPPPSHAPTLEGRACLRDLDRRGVTYVTLSKLKGVENPVEIQGKLGGVTFYANDNRALQLDCRLAIALDNLATVLRQSGVNRIRYSGAYSYRTTRSGRLSHHALGLAIDLHEFQFGPNTLSVTSDFARNVGCSPDNPALNQLACAMRDEAMFEEFLTPDYNYDHRDHLHISVPRQKN